METQVEQCLRNIGAALAEAGCTFEHVVRVRYILPNAADFPEMLARIAAGVRCGVARRHDDGSGPRPSRVLIEIEATARRRRTRGRAAARDCLLARSSPFCLPKGLRRNNCVG